MSIERRISMGTNSCDFSWIRHTRTARIECILNKNMYHDDSNLPPAAVAGSNLYVWYRNGTRDNVVDREDWSLILYHRSASGLSHFPVFGHWKILRFRRSPYKRSTGNIYDRCCCFVEWNFGLNLLLIAARYIPAVVSEVIYCYVYMPSFCAFQLPSHHPSFELTRFRH